MKVPVFPGLPAPLAPPRTIMGMPPHVFKGLAIAASVIFLPVIVMHLAENGSGATKGISSLIMLCLFSLVGLLLYFLPTLIAWKTPRVAAIIALNFLLGWTVIGWIACLIWALAEQGSMSSRNNRAA
jgi:hypothetical protein